MESLFKVSTLLKLYSLSLNKLSPELLHLNPQSCILPQLIILFHLMILGTVSHLCTQCFDQIPLIVVQLFMLKGIYQLMRFGSLCDLIYYLLLS